MSDPEKDTVASSSHEDSYDAPRQGGRARWSSRTAFYFAAVGSAVGFGNVWRFPSLAADFGGGAFFIPYILAFFVVGLPVLFLEIGLGQYYQTGDVGAFGSFDKRLRGIGVCSIAGTYILRPVYGILFAWMIRAFVESFSTESSPWGNPDITGREAFLYFFDGIVEQGTLTESNRPTRLVASNFAYAALTWFITWLCVAWGVRWTGRVTYLTMGLPVVMLFIFLGRSLSLEGSIDGVRAYIGEWDVSLLTTKGDIWSTAVSQILFSLSLTGGIMTAYGSNCPRNEPALLNSTVIATANSMFSFVAGFAVFGSLGHLAHLEGIAVDEVGLRKGFGLVFGTWPVILNTLPGGIHWVRLLWFNLFMLGIDSAFSGVEGILIVLRDTDFFRGVANWKLAGGLCFSCFVLTLPMCTDSGFKFLDLFDFYINFMFLLAGFLETFAAGWINGLGKQIESIGVWPNVAFFVGNFGSIILACSLWFGLNNGNHLWAGFVGLVAFYGAFTGLAVFLVSRKVKEDGRTLKEGLHVLFWKNVLDFKAELEPVIGWVPTVWVIGMRFVIPQILLILFVNLARAENDSGESKFGHYNEFAFAPFQLFGILSVSFIALLFLAGVAIPSLYDCFIPPSPESTKQPAGIDDKESETPEAGSDTKESKSAPEVVVEEIAA